MKIIFSIVAVLLLFSCKSKMVETTETSKHSDSKSIAITSEELRESVTYLASDELEGRDTGSEGIEKAAAFIAEKFKAYGVKPYFESYRDNYDAKGRAAFNVIGFVEGSDPTLKNEFIILGAHYDHIGFGKPVENDSIANGANDDASGTAAVLAMARYFAAKKEQQTQYSLYIVFW